MTESEFQARRRGESVSPTAEPIVHCINRSISPAGKIKCNCSNQPEAFACLHPFVVSGYCLRTMPGQPGDGPIVRPDGTKIESTEPRHRTFIPWPLKEGEAPRPWEAVICSTCPHQAGPPAHLLPLYDLGIDGDYDPDTGKCDVLHVMPPQPHFDRMDVASLRSCFTTQPRDGALIPLVETTGCRLLIVYGNTGNMSGIKTALKKFPYLKSWIVSFGAQQNREMVPNVWYGLPDDLESELEEKQRACYQAALARILE